MRHFAQVRKVWQHCSKFRYLLIKFEGKDRRIAIFNSDSNSTSNTYEDREKCALSLRQFLHLSLQTLQVFPVRVLLLFQVL